MDNLERADIVRYLLKTVESSLHLQCGLSSCFYEQLNGARRQAVIKNGSVAGGSVTGVHPHSKSAVDMRRQVELGE
jgi:hypothetical protein